MFRNYLKIACRNIIKNPFYSSVNVVGLSAGIAFTLLIGVYVWSELQVNTKLKNEDRQYILQSKWKGSSQGTELTTVAPLAKALRENYPDLVANYYRWDGITSNVTKGDKSFRENIAICDSTMLNMYGFSLLHGDPKTAFGAPFSLIITIDKAIKYFGKTDVVGKALTIENFSGSKHDFIITGVLNKLVKNSVTQLIDEDPNDLFISTDNLSFFNRNMNWNNPSIVSYIELQKGISIKNLEKPIAYLIKQNTPAQIAADMTPYLVSLKNYHFGSNNGMVKKMLYALSAIALFILMMAIINFINMSVSRSATRMREIGIRKVLGGLKKQLISQFLIESILLVFIATLFALLIYFLTQNLFSKILGSEIPSLTDFPLYFIVFPVVLIFIIGFIAGIYPAFILSSLKPVESLKGKLSSAKENVFLRKSLVAFQFGTATIAFIGAIIISKQINLFLGKDLGYDKDYIISAQVPRNWTREGVNKMENIRSLFSVIPEIKNATLSYEIPNGNNGGQAPVYKLGTDSSQAIASQVLISDENYLNVYQIPLKAGSFFEGNGLDSGKIILNETSIKALGYQNSDDAIGRQVRIPGDPTIFTIKGVTKDFHFGSMQEQIAPIIFLNVQFATQYRFLSFKIQPGNVTATIDALQKKWAALMPGTPFEYTFMDDALAKLYKSELQLKKASYTATVLALIIVLLGVLGLISLNIQKRTKEIGIRKVLGSSVVGIISLFMKEFLLVILFAGVVACPLAYIIMNKWLQEYAYRINITAQPFVMSVFILGFITAILICTQTIKAALANPVESLRSE
ncbi:MAG TPA: FtsX-like permease family protein [Chitinophagaceae bacterium]